MAANDREAVVGLQATVADLAGRLAALESAEPASAKAPEKAKKGPAAA
jgi:hypothetical protein